MFWNPLSEIVCFTSQPSNVTGAVGDTVTLSAVAESSVQGVTLSYQWQISNNDVWTDISGATSSTYSTTVDTTSQSYRCVVTSTGGGRNSSNVVTVDRPTDAITGSVDTSRTTAPAFSSGSAYYLPAVANSYYYALSATSSLGKTLSYSWSWEDSGSYVSVVQLSGQTTDRVQLTLTNSDAPSNAIAGRLACTITTPDGNDGYGTTRIVRITCYR